ncbi:molecular chaperone [Erythrobacter sp. JK5]|uniref:molecular chaperone n=1 Tax=Erythrobacter sp. JK5 TaxID=2829500 RepID=UPI001BAC84B2|nr:molecular chaperone [Erythrobacter sp. JK5]QUL37287.1 molecular chaperone [Erythrobacter sp. JK5]
MTAAVLAAAAFAAPVNAQGDLLVAPTRVILDGSRGTEVILSNIGSEEATYRIGLELRRMEENGRLVPVEKAEANATEEAALGMIRYAPRRITLPPGQPQAVRLAARPGADLPDGEYRVHMSFKAIPKPRSVTEQQTQAQGVSIQLIPIYGVTIPIIVRHGRLEAQVAINQPKIVAGENGPELAVTMSRAGDSSVYGELRITKPGLDDPIALLRGVAIYPEIGTRELRIQLTEQQAASITGQLRFEYREMPEAGGGLIAAVDAFVG